MCRQFLTSCLAGQFVKSFIIFGRPTRDWATGTLIRSSNLNRPLNLSFAAFLRNFPHENDLFYTTATFWKSNRSIYFDPKILENEIRDCQNKNTNYLTNGCGFYPKLQQ